MDGSKPCRACGKHSKTEADKRGRHALCARCRGRAQRKAANESVEAKARVIIRGIKYRGMSKSHKVTIDPLWIVTQWYKQHGRCIYSGRAMTLKFGPQSASVDRRNPKKGYTPGNCALCCFDINRMKTDLSERDFLSWCEDVAAVLAAQGANR